MASPVAPLSSDNRFSLVTDEDHQAILYVATTLSLIWSSIVLVARLFVKWGCYGADDAVIAVAQVFCFAQWGAVFVALKNSLGKNISSKQAIDEITLANATAASQVIMIIVLAFCQSSVLLLIQRIFAEHSSRKSMIRYLAGQGIVALWGLGSVLAVSVGCSPLHLLPGNEDKGCSGDVLRWKAVTICGAIVELALAILPVHLVSHVQMKFNRKLLVVIAFGFRLPTAAFLIAHLSAYADSANHDNVGVILSKPILWQQIIVLYSLTATTIPNLKAFLTGFTTGGVGYTSEATLGSAAGTAGGYGKNSGLNSGPGDKQQQQQQPTSTSRTSAIDRRMRLRPEATDYSACVVSVDEHQKENASIASEGSQELIIRKHVDWEVKRN